MFRYIPPDELPGVWEFVQSGLCKVLARTREPWNVVDVRRLLVGGRVSLYVHEHGFVILRRCEEEWSLEPYLLVWVAWFQPQAAADIEERLIGWLDARQIESGCRFIRFKSPRRGWKRVEKHFKPAYTAWERR